MSHRIDNGQHSGDFSSGLSAAKAGSSEALGSLLQACRQYLLLIANEELSRALSAKLGGSDLVQETLMAAHRDFRQFRGATEVELKGWLRGILFHHLRTVERGYLDAEKRSARREVSLNGHLCAQTDGLPADIPSPSRHFMHGELKEQVEAALARLPKRYQRVIELRHRQHLPFEQVAHELKMTSEAARQLWARAIDRMRTELGDYQ
jgi:RNA polymerase sigma-70 factor (ECF subfamily)